MTEDEIDLAVGAYLKSCREALGKSLRDVSGTTRENKELLISGHRLACLERGDCKVPVRPYELKLLAREYGIPYGQLAAIACGDLAPPTGRAGPEGLADPHHQQAATVAAEVDRVGSEQRTATADADPAVRLLGRYGREASLLRETNRRHPR